MNTKESVKKFFTPNKVRVVDIIYLALIALVYLFVSLVNFAQFTIEWSRLIDGAFWVQYALNLGLGLLLFYLMVANTQQKQKLVNCDIVKITKHIHKFAEFIQYNLCDEFDAHLDDINENERLIKYRQFLYARMRKAIFWAIGVKRKEKARKKYQTLIDNAAKDCPYKKVRYSPVTTNLIFSGYSASAQSQTEKMYFTGREAMADYLLPTLIFGLLATMLMLMIGFDKATSGIDKIIQLLFRMVTMVLFTVRGYVYGEYSINTVYISALNERKKFMVSFLRRNKCSISDNTETGDNEDEAVQIISTEVQNGEHE